MARILNRYIIFIIIIGVVYTTWGINSWKFSFIGDEWPFYSYSVGLANGTIPFDIFKLDGVYGVHPIMGSIWPALFIKAFGASNFIWRLSGAVLIIPIGVYFYLWVKSLFGNSHAIFSTIILVTSAFVANYLKIGYNNSISFTLFVISAYYATQIGLNGRRKDSLILGLILGIGFYIYLGPLVPAMIVLLGVPLWWRNRWQALESFAIILITAGVLISIGLLVKEVPVGYLDKTIFEAEYVSNNQIVLNIAHNFLVYFHDFDYLSNHFISGPYFNSVVQILILTGVVILLVKKRSVSTIVVIAVFVVSAILLGLTSPYAYTPVTRGIFLIPFGAVFAGATLQFIYQRKKKVLHIIIAVVLITSSIGDFYESQYGVFNRVGHHYTAYIVKEMQDVYRFGTGEHIVALLPSLKKYNTRNIGILQKAYGLESVEVEFLAFRDVMCGKMNGARVIIREEDTFLFDTQIVSRCSNWGNVIFITNYYFW